MKILHTVYGFTPGNYKGGVSKMAFELARQQVALGHDVSVFTPRLHAEPSGDDISAGVDGVDIVCDGISIYTTRSMGNSSTADCVLQLMKQNEVVHSHNIFAQLNTDVRKAAKACGGRIFYHVHGALDPVVVNAGFLKALKKRTYIRLVERHNLNAAKTIFALTKAEEEQTRSWGVTAPISIIPNGIMPFRGPTEAEKDSFHARFPELRGRNVVLYLGRIVPKKGVDVLVRAFATVAPKYPDTLLVLVGNRGEEPEYTKIVDAAVDECGIGDRVVWPGFLNEAEKPVLLSSARMFSHVSQSEGMAIAVLEAMSAGLPTVISPECYMDTAIEAGAALSSPYDAGALAGVIEKLLGDEMLRNQLSAKALRYVAEQHDWADIAGRIVNCYDCVCKTPA